MNNKLPLILGIGIMILAVGVLLFTGINVSKNTSSTSLSNVEGITTQATTNELTTPTSTPKASEGSYTIDEIASHDSASSCWAAISGDVYDVTAYINQHPGGSREILKICGTDATNVFNAQHGGQRRPQMELSQFSIGTLAQ